MSTITTEYLGLSKGDLARSIVLVGDPERVPLLAKETMKLPAQVHKTNRGLCSMTGESLSHPGFRISVVTSGMGHTSLEAVLREISMTVEDDSRRPVCVVRLGTSGAIQESTELGTAIVASHSVGLDDAGMFYDVQASKECLEIEQSVTPAVQSHARGRFAGGAIRPYASAADPTMVRELARACKEVGLGHKVAVTASASGFFANQGRQIIDRVQPTVPEIDHVLSQVVVLGGVRVENLEMETSLLLHVGGLLGMKCVAICVTIAQRRRCTFLDSAVSTRLVKKASLASVEALWAMTQLKP